MKKITLIGSAIMLAAMAVFFALRGCQAPDELPPVKVYRSKTQQVEQLSLEQYVLGTVAAEMPASFELEALKAQAVCARTYALRKMIEGKDYPRGADLSDDITTCQAYVNAEEFAELHPWQNEQLWAKIQQAVDETRGEVILYDNQLIDALYHSTCGGQTESARELYGKEITYLQSVPCEYCRQSKYYLTEHHFTWQQVSRLAGKGQSIQVLAATSSGRIQKIKVNQKAMSGSEFRSAFGLPSTWCTIGYYSQGITITSRGYGHGMGLCQYGAQGMALQGKNYRQILAHYYPKTQLYKLPY
ncbi:MAG TPA: stage II sporulation protein D [Syntrophomonadaceae bacterium]|nr:stage II sporulation protein D [Syntrophomonadaceae bacterium]HOQ08583.1 stage II sporulation protein D [Syntrophomonadaceae bacterium]HPU49240.1 stage II sporulation protein D [Syntrophomonadaceae bacterium]